MKKHALSQKLARRAQLPTAQAADALDDVVNDLLRRLRAGNAVTWPGLGTFTTEDGQVSFVAEKPSTKPEPRRRRA